MLSKGYLYIFSCFFVLLISIGYSAPAVADNLQNDFVPLPTKAMSKTSIDYNNLSILLDRTVLYTGESTRLKAEHSGPNIGTRLKTRVGHTSPYHLEGNKVLFSKFSSTHKLAFSNYKDELEALGNSVDISALSRNEQLAYWFNLHNVTVLDTIAKHYPVREPRKLLIGPEKTPFHEAKILNIRGVKLSLRDIRENIVFSNWSDPDVIYGFFHGDLDSPTLHETAFNSKNLSGLLSFSANEFTNSLRGVRKKKRRSDVVLVSPIYQEAETYYFPDFENDLKAHLKKHLYSNVAELLDTSSMIEFSKHQNTVADIMGGVRSRVIPNGNLINQSGNNRLGQGQSRSFVSAERDFHDRLLKKREQLRWRGRLRSSQVVIEDIETADEPVVEIK